MIAVELAARYPALPSALVLVDPVRSTRCRLPVLLVGAWIGAETDVLRLLEIKPDLEVAITVGAGHFHQLEVPEQVNAMIERFLALSLRSADA